ncbi:MAG TPA: hypothetical protein DCR26_07700, partial [Porphyromonadaceae bacterium]|nr:hypothetical protein [Porphyromonadaceae bacterium]
MNKTVYKTEAKSGLLPGVRRTVATIAAAAIITGASARQPSRGYRGFLDWSNDIRTENTGLNGEKETLYYTGFSTSHGYQ